MPMIGPPELSRTARTTAISSLGQLAELIREVRADAETAGRTDPLDFQYSYQDPGLANPAAEPDRHREALAEIEKAGATCVIVSSRSESVAATLEFLQAFGETYLS
jgi:hypothetical protein